MRDRYGSFAELLQHHREGVDFDRIVRTRPGARVVVLAPHGGRLENHTDTIAEAVAADDFSLYCFRSRLGRHTPNLHITSHRFDDPDCLSLVGAHRWAVTIHGCSVAGERAFLGGRDERLIGDLARAIADAGIRVDTTGHPYPGTHPCNIVNRSSSGMGVQVELSMPLRRGAAAQALVTAVRKALVERQNGD
jgi:phage replication-related protein YjqB (UPF0714/DUF867 family)